MSSNAQNVRVNLGLRSYDIAIGSKNISDFGKFITDRCRATHSVVITDDNVQEPHAVAAVEGMVNAGIDVDLISIEPGEMSKSIELASGLWQGLLELNTDRKSIVVAVGGGVVGDLAGFIAATYARGLRFFQVPTSVVAQVDSSVGGKVGINLPDAKNMVGSFYQPSGVFIDTATLDTLPEREYQSGLAEVVKYGVIQDAEFFNYLEANAASINERNQEVLINVIARCCRLKADVVEKDEREETGLRAILNYGHTFGHAFESLSGYGKLLHGEAVSIGMCCAARLANILNRVDKDFVKRQQNLLKTLKLPTETPQLGYDKILSSMMHDKKVEHGKLRFILPSRLGSVELVGNVEPENVQKALEE